MSIPNAEEQSQYIIQPELVTSLSASDKCLIAK